MRSASFLVEAREDIVNEHVGELREFRVLAELLEELGHSGLLVVGEIENLHHLGDSGIFLLLRSGIGIFGILFLLLHVRAVDHLRFGSEVLARFNNDFRGFLGFGFRRRRLLLGFLLGLGDFGGLLGLLPGDLLHLLELVVGLHVLNPLLEFQAAGLQKFGLRDLSIFLEDRENGRWAHFRSLDLEERMGVGFGRLTFLAEVEVFAD